jgi:hypothetical protein
MCRFIEGDFDELLDECRKVCYWSCAGKFFNEFLDEFSGRQPKFFFFNYYLPISNISLFETLPMESEK